MIQNVIRSIGGVGLYGIISITLFFTFFIGMLIWAARLKKSYLNTMRELPLDGGETARNNESNPHPSSSNE